MRQPGAMIDNLKSQMDSMFKTQGSNMQNMVTQTVSDVLSKRSELLQQRRTTQVFEGGQTSPINYVEDKLREYEDMFKEKDLKMQELYSEIEIKLKA
jgi:hypothetical protein